MTKEKLSVLVIALIASGYLSGLLGFQTHYEKWYLPGLIFGVVMGCWFLVIEKIHPVKILFWLASSVLAYFLAVNSVTLLKQDSLLSLFFVCGLVGATVLTIATVLLIEEFNPTQVFGVMLLGGLAGMLFDVTFSMLSVAYILWQLPVGLSLAYIVSRNKKNGLEEIKNKE